MRRRGKRKRQGDASQLRRVLLRELPLRDEHRVQGRAAQQLVEKSHCTRKYLLGPENLLRLPHYVHLLLRVAVRLEGVDVANDVEGQRMREDVGLNPLSTDVTA